MLKPLNNPGCGEDHLLTCVHSKARGSSSPTSQIKELVGHQANTPRQEHTKNLNVKGPTLIRLQHPREFQLARTRG